MLDGYASVVHSFLVLFVCLPVRRATTDHLYAYNAISIGDPVKSVKNLLRMKPQAVFTRKIFASYFQRVSVIPKISNEVTKLVCVRFHDMLHPILFDGAVQWRVICR